MKEYPLEGGPPPPFVYDPPREPWLNIVHMDDEILALDKPSGLLSVPGKGEELADCAQSRVRERFPRANNAHRLDMDTSGLLLFGLNPKAHRYLSIGFERRLTRKLYVALVYGWMEQEEGEISLPLICDWPNRPRQMVDHERGRSSLTRWRLAERLEWQGEEVSRLELAPLTGRSHQLRVHLAAIGHPILGDGFYAHERARCLASRLMLHAQYLSFRHPRHGRHTRLASPPPF